MTTTRVMHLATKYVTMCISYSFWDIIRKLE